MMETSNRQLSNRYNPIQAVSRSGNVWTFQSESSDATYTTTRDGSKFYCSCPSVGLCKHIQSAILDDAREKFGIVQTWTSEDDAKRQKRRKFKIRANYKPAWVTVGAQIDQVANLDAEIAQVSQSIKEARHAKLMTNDGQRRAVAQKQMDAAYKQLNALQVAREREVAKRRAA